MRPSHRELMYATIIKLAEEQFFENLSHHLDNAEEGIQKEICKKRIALAARSTEIVAQHVKDNDIDDEEATNLMGKFAHILKTTSESVLDLPVKKKRGFLNWRAA